MTKTLIYLKILFAVACSQCFAFEAKPNSTISTFVEVRKYQYDEPDIMSKYSDLPLFGLGIDYFAPMNTGQLHTRIKYSTGMTDYSSKNTGKTYDDITHVFTLESVYALNVEKFQLFSGIGYRWLYDDWGGKTSTTGHSTYDRRSRYLYVPIGFSYRNRSNRIISTQLNVLVSGNQKSYLGAVSNAGDISKDQNAGYGLSVNYKLNESIHFFSEYWDIERSETFQGYYEPQNETFETGMRFYLR